MLDAVAAAMLTARERAYYERYALRAMRYDADLRLCHYMPLP